MNPITMLVWLLHSMSVSVVKHDFTGTVRSFKIAVPKNRSSTFLPVIRRTNEILLAYFHRFLLSEYLYQPMMEDILRIVLHGTSYYILRNIGYIPFPSTIYRWLVWHRILTAGKKCIATTMTIPLVLIADIWHKLPIGIAFSAWTLCNTLSISIKF